MSLPMFSHPWELLLNKIWWKSMRGMFEIFTPIFLFLQPRGRKIRSDTKKYISEWSSGYELYRGTWVFIPKGWDHMKKWLRKHDENHEVLEPRFLSLPSCSSIWWVKKSYFLCRELKIWLQVDKTMLNSARSAFWGLTPGVRPFFTPRGSKRALMYLLYNFRGLIR